MKLRTHYESTAFSCYTRDNTIRDFMYNSGRSIMKLTTVLYNNQKMIGKYLVDTISKTLDTFEREDTLYHLHFNFHLFGINGRFSPSYLPLIDLTVSENKAK